MKDNIKMSQKQYNNNNNKLHRVKAKNNYIDLNEETSKIIDYKTRLFDLFKELEEDVSCGENVNKFIIHTGTMSDLEQEINVELELLDNGFVNLSSDSLFGVYLESRFSKKTVGDFILKIIDKKKHKGLMGFDDENWAITGHCKIEEYPYIKWAITDIVEDVCTNPV